MMGRKIILLSDGTGNSAAKVWRTNVWRVFERLDLTENEQVAFYDDGVGTESFKPLAILGGAFGFGLKRNVLALYKFACRNYRSDEDEIFGFGFSRGAFTIRIVIALIEHQGLVHADSESELHKRAQDAYRAYRADRYQTYWPRWCAPEVFFRYVRDLVVGPYQTDPRDKKGVQIAFLGLWDTVAAYGMPVEEMARGISYWIWPWVLPDQQLPSNVKRACHALSIDDDRTSFHPILFDENKTEPLLPRSNAERHLSDETVSQVWFAGAHANVGGGYPDDALAQISLTWILDEAEKKGLRFKTALAASPQTRSYPETAADKDGRLYFPRSGLGVYYRYGPRDITGLCQPYLRRKDATCLPRIHVTAFSRIVNQAHAYAPLGLPAKYEIATSDGRVVAADIHPIGQPGLAQLRWEAQQSVWDTIFLRRFVYLITVGLTLHLLTSPLVSDATQLDEQTSALGPISDAIRLFGSFLPNAAGMWIDGWARSPGHTSIVVALIVAANVVSSRLARKISDRMEAIWKSVVNGSKPPIARERNGLARLRRSSSFQRFVNNARGLWLPTLSAAVIAAGATACASHIIFSVVETSGYVCYDAMHSTEVIKKRKLTRGEFVLEKGVTRRLSEYRKRASEIMQVQEANLGHPFSFIDEVADNPAPGSGLPPSKLPIFYTSNPCQSLGVWIEAGQQIKITFESTGSFEDGSITATHGYRSTDLSVVPIWRVPFKLFLVPLRRVLLQPWFRVIARIGVTGSTQELLVPDPTEELYQINHTFTAPRSGELFLYVNDAVLGLPHIWGRYYEQNRGKTRVLISAP